MTIDIDKVRWASVSSLSPEDGLPNTSERPSEFKDSGLKNNQPLPLQWLNGQFNDIAIALQEAQTQIDNIVGGSSQPTLEAIYPVNGQPYLSFNADNPAIVLGFGTWLQLKGMSLVGLDDTDVDFDTVGETGGSKSHSHADNLAISSGGGHTHTDSFSVDGHTLTIAEMPAHTHSYDNVLGIGPNNTDPTSGSPSASLQPKDTTSTGSGSSHTHGLSGSVTAVGDHTHSTTGGVQSNSNLSPYLVVYMWKRTA